MGYIPSIGLVIALIPPVLMAYAQYGLQTALIVLVGYILINGGVQNFYQPKVMGQRLKVSPVIVFKSIVRLGVPVGRHRRHPGGANDHDGVDHYGELRGHASTGGIDALHG